MKKKWQEITVGILYALILFCQLTKTEDIKVICEISSEAPAGSRVRAVLDISGCRGKPLVLRIAYDGDRLAFGGAAGENLMEGSLVSAREWEIGKGEGRELEISVLTGEEFFKRGRVTLEFYVKRHCPDIPAYIKLCGVRDKLPPQD